ncbi:MAG: hypothetical protein HY319_23545 [Armatimonadetes bacterium]|nr:hypothetical protein [Armatimonadota bacterium]
MGSFFKKNKPPDKKKKAPDRQRLASQMPPVRQSETIDPKAVLKAPDVNLKDKLPPGAAEQLNEQVRDGCRGLLVDPEDEETRIFAVHEDRLVEMGSVPIEAHEELVRELKKCLGGAFTVGSRRYQMQEFESLSDFGSRIALNFFEEGKFDTEQILERRRENIRLINRLKPATSLTRKNILDIYATVKKNPREKDFVTVLREDDLIQPDQAEKALAQEEPVLTVLQNQIFPRKAAASALARYLGVEYVDVEAVSVDKKAARLLDKEWALKKQVIPYLQDAKSLKVAMMDPTDQALMAEIAALTGLEVKSCCSAAQDIMVMIHKAHRVD